MDISSFMALLAEEYVIGTAITCTVVVAIYLTFSIRLIVTARREGINVCASAMIPVYNLILWFRKCLRHRKNTKKIKPNSEITL